MFQFTARESTTTYVIIDSRALNWNDIETLIRFQLEPISILFIVIIQFELFATFFLDFKIALEI